MLRYCDGMKQAHKVTTRFPLPSDVGADSVKRLSDLINEVYDEAESGMEAKGHPNQSRRGRAPPSCSLVNLGRNRRRARGVGKRQRDERRNRRFGMLVADRNYRGEGIGSALVEHAERWAREHACHTMRLEILTPHHWTHPSKEFLRQWYARIGYEPQ